MNVLRMFIFIQIVSNCFQVAGEKKIANSSTRPTSGHFGQPETENQTPSTKARPASRAFPMSKTEYELSMIMIFLVFRQNTVFIGDNLF